MTTGSLEQSIPVAVSARHVHLSQPTIDRLFGRGYVLQPRSPLSQPGQFAAIETITLIGPRGRREHVRVLRHSSIRALENHSVIFGNVVIRVSPDYRLELHLDTDEGNAAGIEAGTRARLVGTPLC